ncbi:IPT/TIG domain-containing protein [Streptomyces rubiginosohelvolus]|uniref:IPT/TIG domain-containing protein n=1 Tax=Streptomyces rubiginosohelvolus TaxID=67362 RepID=UPI0035DDD4C1
MGFYTPNGQRITKAAFPATAVPDPLKVITADVYESVPYGPGDGRPEGSRRHLRFQAGTILPTSAIDRLFAPATIASVTPATGPAAGGTTVTIKGTNLDGVSGVNFGSAAGTELKVISATELRVKTPAVAAGAVNVVVADDAGNVTKNGGFTFA